MEAAVWGLLGTIAGAVASIATTILASRNAVSLQRSAAQSEQLLLCGGDKSSQSKDIRLATEIAACWET